MVKRDRASLLFAIRHSLFALAYPVRLPPPEPILGAGARLVFAGDPARVADALERLVDRRIIDLAFVGLLAARHRRDLDVADHGKELLDAFDEIALGDLHVITVELQAHVLTFDLGDHVGGVLDARKEITGPVARVGKDLQYGAQLALDEENAKHPTVGGKPVTAYRESPDVPKDSRTETYIAMKLMIDNWRWAGVPFYLRTGKAMARRKTEIAIRFKQAPLALFRDTPVEKLTPNWLVLNIQPDEGVSLQFGAKIPGPLVRLGSVEMDFRYQDYFAIPTE